MKIPSLVSGIVGLSGCVQATPPPESTAWSIIGWLIVGGIALYVVVCGGAAIIGFYLGLRERQRALNTEPEAGQNWRERDGRCLHIDEVENGRVLVRTHGESWSESIDEWKSRVRHLHLMVAPKLYR